MGLSCCGCYATNIPQSVNVREAIVCFHNSCHHSTDNGDLRQTRLTLYTSLAAQSLKTRFSPSGKSISGGQGGTACFTQYSALGRKTEMHVSAMQLWLIDYFYLIAGILFLLAGAFYCMHEVSPWLYPGELAPGYIYELQLCPHVRH